ncbi:MAG: hypothetical protein ACYTEQ_16425 [Planctomycetota bacterium]|jgi:hypothetical protein
MQNDRALIGWLMQCLACKATLIRALQSHLVVEHAGRILMRNTIGGKQKSAAFVACPCCSSGNVRLMEIGDDK